MIFSPSVERVLAITYREAASRELSPLTYLTQMVAPEPLEIEAIYERALRRFGQKDDGSPRAGHIWNYAYDIAGLIAPRHLFAENGTEDPIFPVAGTRLAFERTRKIYRVFGKEENLGLETFSGKHEFSGKQGFAFLKANL